MATEHTPTPLVGPFTASPGPGFLVRGKHRDDDGTLIPFGVFAKKEQAEWFIKVGNAHDALVGTLNELIAECGGPDSYVGRKATAALRLAKGE